MFQEVLGILVAQLVQQVLENHWDLDIQVVLVVHMFHLTLMLLVGQVVLEVRQTLVHQMVREIQVAQEILVVLAALEVLG